MSLLPPAAALHGLRPITASPRPPRSRRSASPVEPPPVSSGSASCVDRPPASSCSSAPRGPSTNVPRRPARSTRPGSSPDRPAECSKDCDGCRDRPNCSSRCATGSIPRMHPASGFARRPRSTTSDRRHRSDGITVASPARLAFDLAADLPLLDHVSVVHQLLDRCDVTVNQLRAIGERLCQPRRRGSVTFARTLEKIGSDRPVDSHDELTLLDALRRRDVPVETQVPIPRRLERCTSTSACRRCDGASRSTSTRSTERWRGSAATPNGGAKPTQPTGRLRS